MGAGWGRLGWAIDHLVVGLTCVSGGFEGVRGLDRKKLGLLAVAFVLVVAVMEIAALKVGSFDFPLPSDSQPAVADQAGGN